MPNTRKNTILFSPLHPRRITNVIEELIVQTVNNIIKESNIDINCSLIKDDNNLLTFLLTGKITTKTSISINLTNCVKSLLETISVDDTIYFRKYRIADYIDFEVGDVAKVENADEKIICSATAINDTDTYNSVESVLANKIIERIEELRWNEGYGFLGNSTAVAISVDETGNQDVPYKVRKIVINQEVTSANMLDREIEDILTEGVIDVVIPLNMMDINIDIIIGRIDDFDFSSRRANTYTLSNMRHGVNITNPKKYGPLVCRYIAKNIVASGLIDDCTVEIEFFNQNTPILKVSTTNNNQYQVLADGGYLYYSTMTLDYFNITTDNVVKKFDLNNYDYSDFLYPGDNTLSYEKTDLVYKIKKEFNL